MAEKMLEVPVAELLPGDVLATDVFNAAGKILVIKNTIVSDNLIVGLKKNYIDSVFIYRDISEEHHSLSVSIKGIMMKEAEEIIDNQILKYIKKDKNIKEIKTTILEILKSDRVISLLMPLRALGENLFRHSLSVGIYAVAVGKEMFFPQHRLFILGTAALLHDVGMREVPKDILLKNSPLTEEEKLIIQRHPWYGFEIVKGVEGFSAEIYNVILEHHERYDGTGYPNALPNEKIHTMAKIIAVCDVYDALTSDRPHRTKHKRTESIEYLLGAGNFYFNHEIVKALINTIIIYRYGQWVELNTGETGVVIEEEVQPFNIKPKVMLYFDEEGKQLKEPRLIDLSLRDNINISIQQTI